MITTFTLPAYWASYLINGDASGLDVNETAQVDQFLADNHLPMPVDCGDEYFSWHNDSGNGLGGHVCEFSFLAQT